MIQIYGTTTKIKKVLCMDDTKRKAILVMDDQGNHYTDERDYTELSIGDNNQTIVNILPWFYRVAHCRILMTGDLK